MKPSTYSTLQSLGYSGSPEDPAKKAIDWLSVNNHLRIEPYWHFLGADGGYSWSKSWDCFSDRVEVKCETWEGLLEIALERSLEEAFPHIKREQNL